MTTQNKEEVLFKSLEDLGMSKEDIESKNDIIKSLHELDFSTDQIFSFLEKSEDKEEKKDEEVTEETYSEDKASEMEKACMAAKSKYEEMQKTYDGYMAKKPKDKIQKSEETNISEPKEDKSEEIVKSIEESFSSKVDEIQKGFADTLSMVTEKLSGISDRIDNIENNKRPAMSQQITPDSVIQKAMSGGIQDNDNLHLSEVAHKEKIGNILQELQSETSGELSKSIEAELFNYVAGGSGLGETSKRLLREKKNVIVG